VFAFLTLLTPVQMTDHCILALAIGTTRGAMAIGQRTHEGAIELHEANWCRIGSGIGPAPAGMRFAAVADLIQQSRFLEKHPQLRFQVRLAKTKPEILLEDLVRNLLGPNLEGLTDFDPGVRSLFNLVRLYGPAMESIGLIDFGCYYTEFAAQFAPNKRSDAIIRIGGVHITNDISIGLRIPSAQAEKLKRRFGLGKDPQIDPGLESQVQDAGFYRQIVHARVSEILDALERGFPNDFSVRDLTGGLWITGGGSKLPGLTNFLQEGYSLPVQLMSNLPVPWNSSVHAAEETWSALSLLCR
jgi:hypothetical protein